MKTISFGDFIKHDKFLDMCIKVLNFKEDLDKILISGIFYNQGYTETFCIDKRINFTIDKDKLKDWKVLDKNCKDDKCFRYSVWNELK